MQTPSAHALRLKLHADCSSSVCVVMQHFLGLCHKHSQASLLPSGVQEDSPRGLLGRHQSASSACRYQRFLEEELGQLLQSQMSQGQSGRHLSGQAIHNNRQPCHIGGLVSGQAWEPHGQLLLSVSQSQRAAVPLQQADPSLANKHVSDPSYCVDVVLASRVPNSGLHSQQKSHSQRVSDSAYLAKLEYPLKGSQLDDRRPQLHARQHRGQSKSAEVTARSVPKSQSEVQSNQSSITVSRMHGQPCEIALTHKGRKELQQIGVGRQGPVKGALAGTHGLRGEFKGQAADTERHKACSEGHRTSGNRMEEDVVQLRHVLGHSRGCSPQRRQLLLHRRFSLFDSDSSSSEDEEDSQQVAPSSHVCDVPLSVSHPSSSSVALVVMASCSSKRLRSLQAEATRLLM